MPNQHVWIAGKGPSLLTFNWSQAGPSRLAINEAAYHVPELWAAIASDRIMLQHYERNIPAHVKVFCPRKMANQLNIVNIEPYTITRCPTVVRALVLMAHKGFTHFHMIGFDSRFGDDTYAGIKTLAKPAADYKRVNELADRTIEDLKLNVTWEKPA